MTFKRPGGAAKARRAERRGQRQTLRDEGSMDLWCMEYGVCSWRLLCLWCCMDKHNRLGFIRILDTGYTIHQE